MLKLLKVVRSPSFEGVCRTTWSRLHTAQRVCGTHFDRVVPARQSFETRHIGPNDAQKQQMLQVIDCKVSVLHSISL